VQPTWDWCETCGYDPEGKRPTFTDPAPEPAGATAGGGRSGLDQRLVIGGAVVVALIVVAIGAVLILGEETVRPPDEELAVVSTTSTVLGSPPDAWSRHDGPDGSYSIDFPGTPRVREQGYEGVTSSGLGYDGQFEYAVLVFDYDEPIPGTAETVNFIMSQFAGRYAVRNRVDTTFLGHPAQRFDMSDPQVGARKGEGTSIIFVVDQRVYWLLAAGPNVPIDAQRFFDSMVLNG
jgi:hypothetical protein